MFLRRLLIAPALSLLLAGSPTGCATIASSLPGILLAVADGSQILDQIAQFVQAYFAAHPDAGKQAAVNAALTKAQAALNVALRAAQGAKDVNDKAYAAAVEDFRQAYEALLALAGPVGVRTAGDARVRVTPDGGLEVPRPLLLTPLVAPSGTPTRETSIK